MTTIINHVTRNSHTIVKGYRQYEFTPLGDNTVVVVCYAERMIVRREVSYREAREQWQRLVKQGYQDF